MKHLVLAVLLVLVNEGLAQSYRYNLSYYINELQKNPMYVDNSGFCPKLYYGAYRVAKNCSSRNLALNFSVLTTDTYYVTELILSNNNFGANLPYREINLYDSLDYLDLSNNRINEFTYDLTLIDCSVNYLKEINLNNNQFSRFPVFNTTCSCIRALRLNNNKNLVVLDNPLIYPNDNTSGLRSLIYLDLANCSIEYINLNMFTILKYFPSLAYLNLYGNRIKMIFSNPFNGFFLNYLTFEGNLIQCTVDILWVKPFFLDTRRPTIYTILPNGSVTNIPYRPTCYNLLTNTTESIIDLDDSAFYTNIYLSSSLGNNSIIKTNAGRTIDLDCSVYSKPPPDIWWTFNDRVLSRIVTTDSPYEFIENFNATFNPFNKTTILRIKNVFDKLSGVYSCKATYMNMSRANILNNISAIYFNVEVSGGGETGGLSGGAIAGIVIGSILAFLLACLLIALCIWCCCYQLGWCLWCCFCCPCCARLCRCCPGAGGAATSRNKSKLSESKSRLYSSSRYDTTNGQRFNQAVDLDDKQSGFDDMLARSRPNYIINSISKSTSSIGDVYQNKLDAGKSSYQLSSNDFYQIAPVTVDAASASSWRIGKPTQASSSYQDMITQLDQETLVYNVSSRKQNPYVASNNNDAFVGDSMTAISTQHVKITPPGSPKLSGGGGSYNTRVVETTQFTQNRYVPSPMQQTSYETNAEMLNENYFNQVVVNNEEHSYTPAYQQYSGKQYKNIPITVTTATNSNVGPSYSKYDSDV